MPSIMTYLDKLVHETHKSEAELMTLAFQTGIKQLWREKILGNYLRKQITRNEAIDAVGIDWVEIAERQHKAVIEDLEWALKE